RSGLAAWARSSISSSAATAQETDWPSERERRCAPRCDARRTPGPSRACARYGAGTRGFERGILDLALPRVSDGRISRDQLQIQHCGSSDDGPVERISGEVFPEFVGLHGDRRRQLQNLQVAGEASREELGQCALDIEATQPVENDRL